ncbi:hypothetical protein B0T20DRAFT_390209 [Sordaria brevicollis]|uniref:Uncharacterized protein n=1 Tax=Sordaria brevicollis TaxID=83679 RepID=A0AAE0PMI8_SORBR|nr:hypothetical protein B0T20DRAFT_390209 [Sordaria brevicollis]
MADSRGVGEKVAGSQHTQKSSNKMCKQHVFRTLCWHCSIEHGAIQTGDEICETAYSLSSSSSRGGSTSSSSNENGRIGKNRSRSSTRSRKNSNEFIRYTTRSSSTWGMCRRIHVLVVSLSVGWCRGEIGSPIRSQSVRINLFWFSQMVIHMGSNRVIVVVHGNLR